MLLDCSFWGCKNVNPAIVVNALISVGSVCELVDQDKVLVHDF